MHHQIHDKSDSLMKQGSDSSFNKHKWCCIKWVFKWRKFNLTLTLYCTKKMLKEGEKREGIQKMSSRSKCKWYNNHLKEHRPEYLNIFRGRQKNYLPKTKQFTTKKLY